MPSDTLSPALSRWSLLWAMLAGATAVVSFAPLTWWPVQIASLAVLLWLAVAQTAVRRSALIGWSFSFGWMAAGTHWLYTSLHDYGGLPAPMAVAAVLLLSAAMALYSAMAMAAGTWLRLRCARNLQRLVPRFLRAVIRWARRAISACACRMGF